MEIDAVTIKKSMTDISPLNKSVWLTIYSNTVVYGGNEYGESGHLTIFTLLKHLMMLLKYKFFGASFLHLIKDTDSM